MSSLRADVTRLLQAAHDGEADAFDRVFLLVYDELHRLAQMVRQDRSGATLNTTALVHEAYLKLVPSTDLDWKSRLHFFRVAASAMRQVLVDAAKHRAAQKRGSGVRPVTLSEELLAMPVTSEVLLSLEEALQRLERRAPRQAQVVECRFFAGLTMEETAQALGVSMQTVARDWRAARAWLTKTMKTP